MKDNREEQPQLDEMYIVELDDRLEFGVASVYSAIHPDTNGTNCVNGVGCTSGNAPGACANLYLCANTSCA